MQVSGGAGIAGDTQIGGSITQQSSSQVYFMNSQLTAPSTKSIFFGNGFTANNTGLMQFNFVGDTDPTNSITFDILYNGSGSTLFGIGTRKIYTTLTTSSTSTDTGALVVSGGVGVGGTLRSASASTGSLSVTNTTSSVSTATGAIVISGGVGIRENIYVGNNAVIQGTTDATSTSVGTVIISGGVGIAKNAHIGGTLAVRETNNSTSVSTGAMIVSGGLGITSDISCQNEYIYGTLYTDIVAKRLTSGTGITVDSGSLVYINNTTDAVSLASGSTQILGGCSISKSLYVGTNARLISTTDSASTLTGVLVVSGGVGVAKTLYATTVIPTNLTMTQNVTKIDTDVTLAANLDTNLATQRAIKTYVDNHNHTWHASDVKTSGTSGGTFTTGSWQRRTLNTLEGDTGDTSVTLATNQLTIQAGQYLIIARAPGHRVGGHQARIQDITNAVSYYGSTAQSVALTTGIQSDSYVYANITVASATVFELQHRGSSTRATDGYGLAVAFGNSNIYSEVTVMRIGT